MALLSPFFCQYRRAALVVVVAALLCACHPTMTSSSDTAPRYPGAPDIDRRYTGTVDDWPLFFIRHGFASDCFDTQYCLIAYGSIVSENSKPQPSIESFGDHYPAILTNAVSIAIDNFAGPVEIDWKAKDGTPLQASLDFDVLFKDRLTPLPPGVRRDDIPETIGISDPTIIVEVVDRTVNVWTRTRIPMKEAQIPGNRYSYNNDDLVRVFSQIY